METQDRGQHNKQVIKNHFRNFLVCAGYHSSPKFIIIGAQKAGTSSLFDTLSQHPNIVRPFEKELHYFDASRLLYGKVDRYYAKFPLPHHLSPDKITFEASPSYLYHPEAAERIFQFNPTIKLIAILREPVSRALSAYNFYAGFKKYSDQRRQALWEKRSFEDAIEDELSRLSNTNFYTDRRSYLSRGLYGKQLSRYFRFFSRDKILVIDYFSYSNFFELEMRKICEFLEINNYFFKSEISNATEYKQKEIDPAIKERLKSFFKPYNQELFQLLGREFNWQ